MSFPARVSHLVITAAHRQPAHVLSLISKMKHVYFSFVDSSNISKQIKIEVWGFRKTSAIMKHMKCLKRTIYKYSPEVLMALRNSMFTLPCSAP